MPIKDSVVRFWNRYRRPLVVFGVLGWAAFITMTYRRSQAGPRTIKGAKELLEIGALPVT